MKLHKYHNTLDFIPITITIETEIELNILKNTLYQGNKRTEEFCKREDIERETDVEEFLKDLQEALFSMYGTTVSQDFNIQLKEDE